MQYQLLPAVLFSLLATTIPGNSQDNQNSQSSPLIVAAGTPLRVYLTKRLNERMGEPVEAKLLDPLYVFDREVAPAGSQVLGKVIALKPVTKMQRTAAILGGDFTPLQHAQVAFDTLVLADGRRIALHTTPTAGLNSIADLNPSKRAAANQKTGVIGTAKAQVQNKIDTTRKTVFDAVHSPDKKDQLEDFLLTKLPYHPQHVRRGTRFDAELLEPLQFGSARFKPDDLLLVGSQPAPGSSVQARLITPLESDTAKQGERVEAILSRPLFTTDHKLLLPEGTRLTGAVTMVHRARWFHRGGQLRFNFEWIDLPAAFKRSEPALAPAAPSIKTLAMLQATEPNGKAPVKVDSEGGVKATEPKTRFIAPAVALLLANHAGDNDVSKRTGLPENNTGGRALGGVSGFGLLGAAAAKTSTNVARAFGFYGLAWSVYLNVISRGNEVSFQKNAAIDIRFGARAPAPATKFRASAQQAPSAK